MYLSCGGSPIFKLYFINVNPVDKFSCAGNSRKFFLEHVEATKQKREKISNVKMSMDDNYPRYRDFLIRDPFLQFLRGSISGPGVHASRHYTRSALKIRGQFPSSAFVLLINFVDQLCDVYCVALCIIRSFIKRKIGEGIQPRHFRHALNIFCHRR